MPPDSETDSKKRLRSLRERAEKAWQGGHRHRKAISKEELPALLHELEVHQIELEMQNEELRRAQVELEESRDHLLDLYEFAPVGYLTLDDGAIIKRANLRTASLLGVERGTLAGKRFTEYLVPESRDAFYLYWRGLTESTTRSCELLMRRSDETHFWVYMETVDPVEPGGWHSWRCAITDITKRKCAENELRRSERRLQSYMDHAGDGIFVLDSDSGRILSANIRGAEMLGYSQDELLKLTAADIEAQHLAENIRALHLRTKREVIQVQGIHRRKDGSTFPVEIRLTSLHPTQKDAVLAIVRDITERKQIEEERAREARRKDEFLAMLGHELRNPLAAISALLEVLPDSSPDERAELERLMRRQIVLMQRLMDDLLDLNRIAHGLIELRNERIDLTDFLQDAAATARSAFENRSSELLVRVPPEPVQFVADRVRLKQIAANLLSNAFKYTPQGGTIELSGDREGTEIVLRCKDNGQGISPDDMERIFQPFARGRQTAQGSGEASLGIGLALVKQLVELHGGTISVKSAGIGQGSEFIVRMPLLAPLAVEAVSESEEPKVAHPYRPRTILVVEDNPNVAVALKIALERAGNDVRAFSDGPSTLAGVAGLRFDAILLDIGLPGMDGYELAAELKKQPAMRSAVFVAISGFGKREQATGRGGNFDYYFTKPVDVPALLDLIDKNAPYIAKQAADRSQEGKRFQPLRVLLVEDYTELARATAQLFQYEGLEIRIARTGREALDLASNFLPQLIVCDRNLPDMSGLEVIRRLRSNSSTQSAYAVVVTAMSDKEVQMFNRKRAELGVDEFVCKPLTREAIRDLKAKVELTDARA
jgi:two-component system CheB/CheR fusion protein